MNFNWSLLPATPPPTDAATLASFVQSIGITTAQISVGRAGSINVDQIYPELPDFVNELSKAGVEAHSIQLDLRVEELIANPDYLALFEACGITEITLTEVAKKGYLVRSRLTKLRTGLEKLDPLLQKHKLRLLLPVFGTSLLPSPSAAFHILRGLPPFSFGAQLDPGGEHLGGFEPWDYTVAVLGDYLASILIRDSLYTRDDQIQRTWVRPGEGLCDWPSMVEQLSRIEYQGSLLLAPMLGESPSELASQRQFIESI